MSLYVKEHPDFLEQCLKSIKEQTLVPDQIIVVEDGPLTKDLYDVLDSWQSRLPIERVVLRENVGLGVALNNGLKHCSHNIVARMDTDDICYKDRFEKQVPLVARGEADICGSWVTEFEKSIEIISSYRKLPEHNQDVISAAKKRNPLNHPSVVYKKDAVLGVGGYDDVRYFEDYHLWLKLIDKGCRFYNFQEPLVSMRAGNAQLSRRGGVEYAKFEFSFFKRCRSEGLMSNYESFKNVALRVPLRLMPRSMLGKVYRILRKL